MGWWPWKNDPKVRCGSGPIFSTDWMWKLAYHLGMTKYKKDPFIDVCEADDRLTDESLPGSNLLPNKEELERVKEMYNEVDKDVHHPNWKRFELWVLKNVRGYFDKN